MQITDELRKYAKGYETLVNHKLLAIADRIDAEHERQLEVLYRDMSDAEYVELPKDADGEYIHIGDVMEWCDADDSHPLVVRTVDAVGTSTFFAWVSEGGKFSQFYARNYRHHHNAPTVEDVLRDFAFQIGQSATDDDIVAEFAAKLRLKEDA